MSATFKLAKQKHTQQELRKLMNEQKPKVKSTATKIDSPLAKYPLQNLFYFYIIGDLRINTLINTNKNNVFP